MLYFNNFNETSDQRRHIDARKTTAATIITAAILVFLALIIIGAFAIYICCFSAPHRRRRREEDIPEFPDLSDPNSPQLVVPLHTHIVEQY